MMKRFSSAIVATLMPTNPSKTPTHKFQALHLLADAAIQVFNKPSFSWSLQVQNSKILCFKPLFKPPNPPLPLPLARDLHTPYVCSPSGLDVLAHAATDLHWCFDIPKKKRSPRLQYPHPPTAVPQDVQNQPLCIDLNIPKKKRTLKLTKPHISATGVGVKRGFESQANEGEEECCGRKLKKRRTQTEDIMTYIESKGVDNPPLLVITKQLFNSDLNTQQARFSIPLNQIISPQFLTPQEKERLDEKNLIEAILIEPCLAETPIRFSKWHLRSSNSYVLKHGWTSVIKKESNKQVLKLNATVQLWSFHCNGQLYFALTKPGSLDHHSDESSLTGNANGASTGQSSDSHASTVRFQDQL